MDCTRHHAPPRPVLSNKRANSRRAVTLPARLAWKDSRGINRFASVVARDVSDCGVYTESPSTPPIPLHRLVHFQLEPSVRDLHEVPEALRQGRVLSAVYRVSHATKKTPQGFALRLRAEPRRPPVRARRGPPLRRAERCSRPWCVAALDDTHRRTTLRALRPSRRAPVIPWPAGSHSSDSPATRSRASPPGILARSA